MTQGGSESLPPASEPGSEPEPLDALFSDSQFKPYDEAIVAEPARRRAPSRTRATDPHGISRTQKTLIAIAGAFVAVLALVALFFLGTRLPTLIASSVASPSPTPAGTPTPTPTPTPTAGPAGVGIHGWNELRGGECLNPYTSPWVEKFTVVDCTVAHPAQMVFRGTFNPATTPTFPGTETLQAQISLLCAAPGVLDLGAAGQYADAQVQGSYPVTDAEWTGGQHDYFCFISRAGGQPLTGSVAVAPAP